MADFTEYQKTLLELYQREGENAVRQYFRRDKVSEDVVEQKLQDFLSLLETEATYDDLIADGKKNQQLETEEETATVVEENTEGPADVEIETHIVTFADGSTQEIQTANGVVINPIIPVIDLQTASEEAANRDSVIPEETINDDAELIAEEVESDKNASEESQESE